MHSQLNSSSCKFNLSSPVLKSTKPPSFFDFVGPTEAHNHSDRDIPQVLHSFRAVAAGWL